MNKKALAAYEKKLESYFNRKLCLAPFEDCSSTYVRAHTISKERHLRKIAEKGHVEAYKANLWNRDNTVSIGAIGIKEASAFYGFCSKHDTELFFDIDNLPYSSSPKQNFLFAYRGIAKEYYSSEAQLSCILTPEETMEIEPYLDPFETIIQYELKKGSFELRHDEVYQLKNRYDNTLRHETYSEMSHFCISFENTPTLVVSSVFSPWYDFEGNQLQDFGNRERPLNTLAVNVVPVENGGVAIFSYFSKDWDGPKQFVDSLKAVSKSDVTDTIINLIFSNFTNLACNPSWWKSIELKKQNRLTKRLKEAMPDNPADPSEWFRSPVRNLSNWKESRRWDA